jgi:hypothetical protein
MLRVPTGCPIMDIRAAGLRASSLLFPTKCEILLTCDLEINVPMIEASFCTKADFTGFYFARRD